MSELRKALARDIHKSGMTEPEDIAGYLVKQGWIKLAAIQEAMESRQSSSTTIVQSAPPAVMDGVLLELQRKSIINDRKYGIIREDM